MNERQLKFIEMLEKHLAQEVSRMELYNWLGEMIIPLIHTSKWYKKPGKWLEEHTCRIIRSHISDLEDPSIPPSANLDGYWRMIKRHLDFLVGNKTYKVTHHTLEYPLNDKLQDNERWMLPYLTYAEKALQILLPTKTQDIDEIDLPKIEAVFVDKPLAARTVLEIMMDEILSLIQYYKDTISSLHSEERFRQIDSRTAALNRLEKLIGCFKGEAFYAISVTFEGVDKFSITLIID